MARAARGAMRSHLRAGSRLRLSVVLLLGATLLGGQQTGQGGGVTAAPPEGPRAVAPPAPLKQYVPLDPVGRASGFEAGDFRDFHQTNTEKGALRIVRGGAAEGNFAVAASFAGGRGIGFARTLWFVDWAPGSTVCYGGSFYLPAGFAKRNRGSVDLMRWDNYVDDPAHTDHGGLTVWADGGLRLLTEQLGRQNYRVLLGPYPVPEGRWVRLVVLQALRGSRPAWSQVFLDGRSLGTTQAVNSYGRAVTTIRWGVVSVDAKRQDPPLELRFDDVFYREGVCLPDDM